MDENQEPSEPATKLKETHPELYGALMLANQRIENASNKLLALVFIPAIILCVGLHMRWFDTVFDIPADRFRGWMVYVVILLLTSVLFGMLATARERRMYRALKPDIINALKRNNLSVEVLLAEIADDGNLDDVKERLLNDKQIQRKDEVGFG